MYCRCGREKIVANGHCATCYTLHRQDTAHFGGLRERVLERDGYLCRGCGASGRNKRSIAVHHRRPGRSRLDLMISLCPACHAKIHRTAGRAVGDAAAASGALARAPPDAAMSRR